MIPPADPYSHDPWSWASVIFRPIRGFLGYGVDTFGIAWSCRKVGRFGGINGYWRPIKPGRVGPYSYLHVSLRRDGKTHQYYVHHLVLAAFVGPKPPGMECLHRDGNPGNNGLGNLRWGTSAENSEDTVRMGRQTFGELVPQSKITDEIALDIFRLRNGGCTHREIAKFHGISRSIVGAVLRKETWKHVALPQFPPTPDRSLIPCPPRR